MHILLTGAAGFIGAHVARLLLDRGDTVVGLDNLNAYYDPQLKRDRLARLTGDAGLRFVQLDVADRSAIPALFAAEKFDRVVHLAAQAGVRHSLVDPHAYIDSNIVGFMNILEGCRHHGVQHLVYASSSSVYGGNTVMPFSEHHGVDHPVSLYAASKKANELMAHTYSHLFGLPTTGLRGQVHHAVEALGGEQRRDGAAVGHVQLHEAEAVLAGQPGQSVALELGVVVGIQVVQPHHRVAAGQQQAGDMGADEAGGAGEQDVHGSGQDGGSGGGRPPHAAVHCCRSSALPAPAGRQNRGNRHVDGGAVTAAEEPAGRIRAWRPVSDWRVRA